jgi:hypothetical protein
MPDNHLSQSFQCCCIIHLPCMQHTGDMAPSPL